MTDEDKNTKSSDSPNDERIQFNVKILPDGTTVYQDVPSEILDALRKLYPDNTDIENLNEVLEKDSVHEED